MLYPSIGNRNVLENPEGYRTPDERQMNYSPIRLETDDLEVIEGWYIAQNDPRNQKEGKSSRSNSVVSKDRRLVVFFHENAGNLGYRLSYFAALYHKADCDVLALAYRGYSSSTGSPSEEGL